LYIINNKAGGSFRRLFLFFRSTMSSKPGSNKPAGKTMSSKPGSNKPAGKNQGRGNKKPFVNPHRLINGSKGFLFSHTLNRDKESKREAYNLLKNYADIMYGPEESDKDNADIMYGPEESDKDKKDIEDALKAEIKEIKSSKKARRFTALQDFGCTLFVGCDAVSETHNNRIPVHRSNRTDGIHRRKPKKRHGAQGLTIPHLADGTRPGYMLRGISRCRLYLCV
jgi:hypothetical protein